MNSLLSHYEIESLWAELDGLEKRTATLKLRYAECADAERTGLKAELDGLDDQIAHVIGVLEDEGEAV